MLPQSHHLEKYNRNWEKYIPKNELTKKLCLALKIAIYNLDGSALRLEWIKNQQQQIIARVMEIREWAAQLHEYLGVKIKNENTILLSQTEPPLIQQLQMSLVNAIDSLEDSLQAQYRADLTTFEIPEVLIETTNLILEQIYRYICIEALIVSDQSYNLAYLLQLREMKLIISNIQHFFLTQINTELVN